MENGERGMMVAAVFWFPCSCVGTHMVCIPTQEHGNENEKNPR